MSHQDFEDQIGVTRFVPLNGVPTKIIVFDSAPEKDQDHATPFSYDRLILMISGNPGEIEYYRNYLSRVHQQTNLPVIGVSNSGHNRLPAKLSMPDVHKNSDLYGLDGQVLNKVAFIEQYISKRTRLMLLGHSIGTYKIIELLDQYPEINRMVDHSVLIMPSLDNMAQTEMGQKVTRLFSPMFYYPLMTLAFVLDTLLPLRAQRALAHYILQKDTKTFTRSDQSSSSATIPKCVLESATNLFNPNCLRALIHMTRTEFAQVLDPKVDAIERQRDKLTILYGENDHWCPVPYFERLRAKTSDQVDMRLCLGTVDHAFVIDRAGTEMIAQLTVDILEGKLKSLK